MDKIKLVYANTMDYGFSLQQRPHHIMNSLAKMGYDIHWINTEKQEGKTPDRYPNLTVWHNWENFIRRNPECDIYFSSWSKRHGDLDKLKIKKVVYDSLDNFKENEEDEEKMVSKSDLVFTTSQPLFDLRNSQHHNVHMCKNGCWYGFKDKIDDSIKPKDVSGDYILFSGAIGDWVDVNLINKLAEQFQVVVVGAYFGGDSLSDKVKALGTKNYVNLQTYYKNALVNIVPFKRCQTSDYSNPIKMYESAVFGVPTVSTDIPEAVSHKNVVYTATNHNDFIGQVQKAIKQRNDPVRKQALYDFAKENDWMVRVNLIDKEMRKLF